MRDMNEEVLKGMVGRIAINVEGKAGEESVVFYMEDGKRIVLSHSQDCCEYVRVEDIIGDLGDLMGAPILAAEESTSQIGPDGEVPCPTSCDSFTWTFYKFATKKGYVTIRWLGSLTGTTQKV